MSSNLQDEQMQTELETAELEHWVVMGESLERLMDNADFKRIILDGYLKDKVLDSMTLLADPGIIKRNERPLVMEDMVAASNLNYFFAMVRNQHEGALNVELEQFGDEPEGAEV